MRKFLDGQYLSELNRSNWKGHGGKLAMEFGAVMEKLWQVGCSGGTCYAAQHLAATFQRAMIYIACHQVHQTGTHVCTPMELVCTGSPADRPCACTGRRDQRVAG